MSLVRVKCPGYRSRSDGVGGTYPIRCPELSRWSGYNPVNPIDGYPDNWDRRCPTCDNTGIIYMEAAEERVDAHYY